MKRLNNLYAKIYSLDNLQLADKLAQKGKSRQPGVIVHNRNQGNNLQALHQLLVTKTFKTSEYTVFRIYEPKAREIHRYLFTPTGLYSMLL